MSMIHVVYNGKTEDFEFDTVFSREKLPGLGITVDNITPQQVTHDQIKLAMAQQFDVGVNEFNDFFIEINSNGNITVRPQTTFG